MLPELLDVRNTRSLPDFRESVFLVTEDDLIGLQVIKQGRLVGVRII